MRKPAAILLCLACLLCGCGKTNAPLDHATALRNKVLESNGCSFQSTVTADYGQRIYTFSMDCQTDNVGNLTFTVIKPDTISGITGKVSASGGAITFDDRVLAFQTMADGQISPVTAPWVFIKSLRSGYLKGCAATQEGIEISIDDTYAEDALFLKIKTEGEKPVFAEIFWQGRRVLSLTVENFTYL